VGNFRKYGGPPFAVAVVHGGPGAPGEMSTVARELSSVVGVLEPLLTAPSVDGQVEELRAVLEENGRLPLSLIGFSWGAWLSVIFTTRYPTYANKLILLSSGPFEEKYATNIMKTRLQRLQKGERREAKALYEAIIGSTLSRDSLTRFGQLISKADSYDLLPDESQVVAIHGDYDPHPADGVKHPLSGAIKDFRFVLLKKCGHYPWRERNARDMFYCILNAEIWQP
jgi:pimeloyl-ACP methyl ester carboxylesterase